MRDSRDRPLDDRHHDPITDQPLLEVREDLRDIERWWESWEEAGFVFLCVDSIETRRQIWEAVQDRIGFLADGRMSAEVVRVLAVCDPAGRLAIMGIAVGMPAAILFSFLACDSPHVTKTKAFMPASSNLYSAGMQRYIARGSLEP